MIRQLVFCSALAICTAPLYAFAQDTCGARGDIVKMLAEKYREEPRALAISSHTNLLEVFTSRSGNWTILITKPKGSSCIVAAGQSWEDIAMTRVFSDI